MRTGCLEPASITRGKRGFALQQRQHVVLVGAGNSSAQSCLDLARYAAKVTIVMRGDCLKANVSDYLVHRIQTTPNIEVLPNTVVTALHGDGFLHAVTSRILKTGEERTIETSSLFLCLGGVPNTEWAEAVGISCDEEAVILGDRSRPRARRHLACQSGMYREPYYLKTNMPGVFAAGDVRHCSIKRLASAVGEGAMAVASFIGILRVSSVLRRCTGGTTMQRQERFQRARAEWMLLTFYERFRADHHPYPHGADRHRRRLRRVEPHTQDLPRRYRPANL